MSEKKEEIIDIRKVLRKIVSRRKVFYITLPIAFVASYALILCVPRYYTTSVVLAPEVTNPRSGGALASLASTFGVNLSQGGSTDAISPLLYPELMDDNKFVVELFSIPVESKDGDIKATYHDYLQKFQKRPWWRAAADWMFELFKKEPEQAKNIQGENNPYILTKEENDVADAVRENISFSVNKKDGVITISTRSQDPYICKTIADSVTLRLQAFITQYRTNKARVDLEHYKKLATEAKHNYEKARQLYGSYADANMDVVLESYKSKQEDLENDMQLKYNTYTAITTQLQGAMAKVQEQTPAFTLLKGAAVPVKPAGPKRMLFVIAMMFLTFFFTTIYVFKDDVKRQMRH